MEKRRQNESKGQGSLCDRFSLKNCHILIQSPQHPYGRAILRGFLAAGAKVWLCGAGAEEAASMEEEGRKVEGFLSYAPRGEREAAALAAEGRKVMGRLDAFVHLSPAPMLPGWEHSYACIDEALQSSQLGLMLMVKHVGQWMVEQGSGSVIFVTDYAALVGCAPYVFGEDSACLTQSFALDYGFVKSSYVNYARQAAGYLGSGNVRCNAIAYGPLAEDVPVSFADHYVRHAQLKRLAREEDVQGAALFLASDASSYITGATLPVDGGYTAK